MTETAQHEYRLLTEFRRLFEGRVYKHRASNQGDFVAMHLYEDLIELNRSAKLREAIIDRRDRVLNAQNRRRGVAARRGDATFGEILPGETPISAPGYLVGRGPTATVEIGVEVKVLAKAMIKQIDRMINDLRNQVVQFKRGGGNPICVAVVGINHADSVIGYEGDRPFPTTGKAGFLHPKPSAVYGLRRPRNSTSFRSCGSRRRMHRPGRLNGSISGRRDWITRRLLPASAPHINSDSSLTFVVRGPFSGRRGTALFSGRRFSGMRLLPMFLRSTNCRKDGRDHRCFSVVENRRLPGGKTMQRTVLYPGYTTMSLFPDDREAGISPEMAVRLSKTFGGSPEMWLRLQAITTWHNSFRIRST